MIEMALIMMAFLYSAFISPNWLCAFLAALAFMAIKHYVRAKK